MKAFLYIRIHAQKIMTAQRSITLSLLFASTVAFSEPFNDHQNFAEHSVYYSVFNSTFIPADIASRYGIKRSKYESLINVSISPANEYGAFPARVSGTVTNLMQQQKQLNFIEIKEPTATYYIAPMRISGEETVKVELSVKPEGYEGEPYHIKFNKKLYSDP